jgi:SAM-dependent methyltransferase
MTALAAPVSGYYSPRVFDVQNLDQAMSIILTEASDMDTAKRWELETPYLTQLIESRIPLSEATNLLDYGCGVGRLSRVLIERHRCFGVGVDISPSMRALAASYVGSDRFFACAPRALELLGVGCNVALAVWALQHCVKPQDDIARIKDALAPGALFFVVNEPTRFVPTTDGMWINDHVDVLAMLKDSFRTLGYATLDPAAVPRDTVERGAYWWLGQMN